MQPVKCGLSQPEPLRVQTARKASESRGEGPVAAVEPATTTSGTAAACDASAACWEEGATGAADAAGGPRQAARADAAAPPFSGVTNIMRRK